MQMTYFNSSDRARKPFGGECNQGIQAVPALLRQLEATGHNIKLVDISDLTEKDRIDSYVRAILPAVYNHYELRKMFGTNRRSACWFGAEVPALHVTDAGLVGDTYPHRKGNHITTIYDFLTFEV